MVFLVFSHKTSKEKISKTNKITYECNGWIKIHCWYTTKITHPISACEMRSKISRRVQILIIKDSWKRTFFPPKKWHFLGSNMYFDITNEIFTGLFLFLGGGKKQQNSKPFSRNHFRMARFFFSTPCKVFCPWLEF